MSNVGNQILSIQEMAIAVAVESCNPMILNPDFLKYSGIVPTDWELARPPIVTNAGTQVTFQTGISILARPNQIVFAESMMAKEPAAVEIPAIAQRCISTLSQISYQAIGVNFTGFVGFNPGQQTAQNYVLQKLLAPGSWQSFGKAPLQAALRLAYTLETAQLNLDISEVRLRLPEQAEFPAVLFAANFNHPLQTPASERFTQITEAINRWQSYLKTYSDLVNTRFFQSATTASSAASAPKAVKPPESKVATSG